MQFFDFRYKCLIKKTPASFHLLEYISPYTLKQDNQSQDDIKEALLTRGIGNFHNLGEGEKKYIEFICRFVENKDGSYDQIFIDV
jgi:hypothetical protein